MSRDFPPARKSRASKGTMTLVHTVLWPGIRSRSSARIRCLMMIDRFNAGDENRVAPDRSLCIFSSQMACRLNTRLVDAPFKAVKERNVRSDTIHRLKKGMGQNQR